MLEDVLDGFVSRDAAREQYGVVVSEAGEVDVAATETLRKAADVARH